MVAMPSGSPNNQLNSQLAIRITQPTIQQVKSLLPTWRPRDGRNESFLKWHDALINVEHDLGIDVDTPCPAYSELVEMIPHYDSKGLVTDEDRELFSLFQAARQEWIDLNETLFDVIRPSLVLEGNNLERDLRMLTSQMNSAKDGRAIRRWAQQFADLSTVASQADLQTKLEVKLSENATLSELEAHCTKLWSTWLLISDNDPNSLSKLESFHYRWLNSLPSQPASSHLANVRRWLAEKISERSSILHDVDKAIDVIVKYASSIGLADIDLRRGPGINAMFGSRLNNCDFCKANLCQSNDNGGVKFCISCWDCKVPILTLDGNDNAKAMVLGLRDYHEANKDAKSLKRVHVDLDASMVKVRELRDLAKKSDASQPVAAKPGAAKQVTPIFQVNAIDSSEITDMAVLQRWLDGGTDGAASTSMIQTIGHKNGFANSLHAKTPRLTAWQERLAAFRSSRPTSYAPYVVHAVGADQSLASKGGNFTSLVRILDQSLSADKAPRARFSLYNVIKAFSASIMHTADSVLSMEARNIVCLLTGVYLIRITSRPWYRPHLIKKLKLLIMAKLVKALHSASSALMALPMHRQMLTA